MEEENSQPQHKTIEDIELLVSIYAYQKELLQCLKEGQGRLPDPKFKAEVASRRLAVECRRYKDRKIPQDQWPPSLQAWANRNQLKRAGLPSKPTVGEESVNETALKREGNGRTSRPGGENDL